MPRKTNENEIIKDEKITTKKSPSKTKSTASTKPNKSVKSTKNVKKETTKKDTKVSATSKKTTKKTTTTKKATKSTSAKKTTSTTKKVKTPIIEYYDLPEKYNKTTVKLLAQTPKTLFVYWEISDEDIENYKKQYGDDFFETTKPVLKIHNITLNYSFEVDINDFANSWYLHVNDSKSNYEIELGRRFIVNNKNNNINSDYIYITSSNKIESPNDHILFNPSQKMVYFKNVKTNQVSTKPLSTITFIKNMGKIYNIYDLYKTIYKNENIEEIYDLSNPSSNSSSQFK